MIIGNINMNNKAIKSKVISSLFWKLMERGGTQGIQFVLQIFLARLLTPNDYGIVALITIFIALANVFVQSGFNTALIQKKDADSLDFSSVFWLSLFVAAMLYCVLFFMAPMIAHFYNLYELINIIRVLALTLFLGAFNSIQNAVIAKRMEFKKLFFSSLGAVIISGIIGIVLAYNNYGVWALVYQQLINQVSICLILWFTVKWRPSLMFSFKRIKKLFSYGGKLLLSSLLDTGYMNLRSLVIGKLYAPAMLGYYNRGNAFPQIIVSNINGSIQSVIFPVLSAEQDNKYKVKEMVRRTIVTSSYLIFPMMIGLGVIGESLIRLILTEKWLPSVFFLRVFCLSYALWPIHTANLQAINALGKSDVFLKLEIIKKILGIGILFITIQYGIRAIALGMLVSSVIASFVNAYPNKYLLNYGYSEQIKDVLPSLVLSGLMGWMTYMITFLRLSDIFTILAQIIVGVFIYIALSYFLNLECFLYLFKTIKDIIKKNNKKHMEDGLN